MTAKPLPAAIPRSERSSSRMVRVIALRELRDTMRDWRIVSPIVILTLIFPWLMNWTARLAVDFVAERGGPLVAQQMIPFLLLIVGFFPITFSLVIALETFVGEKERRSIEPLLSMPITDLELYLGKTIAATALPLTGSLLAVAVYLSGLYFTIGYSPPFDLLALIFVLSAVETLVMVSGAVVVSSQTTSVRAANLLASFIIVPMALLIQAEAIVMFWGDIAVMWLFVLGLLIVMLILIRMGVRTFNREEILGREIDELNLRRTGYLLRQFFIQPPHRSLKAHTPADRTKPALRLLRWIGRVYRRDLPYLLRHNWMPIAVVVITLIAASVVGWVFVSKYPLPDWVLKLENLQSADLRSLSDLSFLPALTTSGILGHNIRALLLAALLAIISLGVVAILMLTIPFGLISFVAGQVALLGYDPWVFVAAFVLPHGLFEIPAAVIATAFALKLGASITAPREGLTVGEGLLAAAADFAKVFVFLVLPLLLIAAFVEANITLKIVHLIYGG